MNHNVVYTKTGRYCQYCGLRTVWAISGNTLHLSMNGGLALNATLNLELRLEQLLCTACGSAFMASDGRKVSDCDPAVQRAYEVACREDQRQHRNRAEQSERRMAERKRREKAKCRRSPPPANPEHYRGRF